jgi:DegV family protein with EDD domain
MVDSTGSAPAHRVGVLTDSTAYLPADLVSELGIEVVPLEVVMGGVAHAEPDVSSSDLAAALKRWVPVSTSRPSPAAVLDGVKRLQERGADEVVVVHLSGEVSGTCSASRLAARSADVPVHVVDSGSLAMGLGYAVLAAARAAHDGADGDAVVRAAEEAAAATRVWFCVDTLEHLRRGGRIGAAQALIGSALAVKPILHLVDGRVQPLEKVRTSTRAMARLVELVVAAAANMADGDGSSDSSSDATVPNVTVHHLASAARAEQLAATLSQKLPGEPHVRVIEVGAVVGAHVGPGTVGVVLSPGPKSR